MSFIRREIYTKDKDLQKYLDTLITNRYVELPPKAAQDIGRLRTIRDIRELNREKPYLLIAEDQKYRISMIKIRNPVRITKKENRYIFSID